MGRADFNERYYVVISDIKLFSKSTGSCQEIGHLYGDRKQMSWFVDAIFRYTTEGVVSLRSFKQANNKREPIGGQLVKCDDGKAHYLWTVAEPPTVRR